MQNQPTNVAEYIRKLCSKLAPNNDAVLSFAVSYLSSQEALASTVSSEQLICHRIRTKLYNEATPEEADKFMECYQKLRNMTVLKNRAALLSFLNAMAMASDGDTVEQNLVGNLSGLNLPNIGLGTSSSSRRFRDYNGSKSSLLSSQDSKTTMDSFKSSKSEHCNLADLTETALVTNVLLSAQGIRSENTRFGSNARGILAQRLAELGFFHDRIKEAIDPQSGFMPRGLIGEGFVSALREEISDYYKEIAMIQSQLDSAQMTLRRATVWTLEPLHRLRWLATIAYTVQQAKGGALATNVHRFLSHGDTRVQDIAKKLLQSLTRPLLLMLSRWLLHGEIEDPYNEFFIEIRSGIPLDRMWHDKYRVREWMVPSFINKEQAAQILATGKSVVFLREACSDHEVDHADHAALLKKLLNSPTGLEEWWTCQSDGTSGAALKGAHELVSSRLLRALTTDHHLLDHLHAHRRYLLLQQGDFHHNLMRLLWDDLNKSASSLYVHNLTCTLEAAVRATNAQYEPPHVLSRLHVNLFPSQPSDCGWDVFALQYRLEGPLGTLFPASIEMQYRALFSHLWRIKRIEHGLHLSWREHAVRIKEYKNVPETSEVLSRTGRLRAECSRLIIALQDGGGREGAWRKLVAAAADGSACLDTLLSLHKAFVERAAIEALVHPSTKELQTYLGNVLEEILTLRSFEEGLQQNIALEVQRRNEYEKLKKVRNEKGEWSSKTTEEQADKESRKIFQQYLVSRKADINVLTRTYRGHVKDFLLKLALHNEVSLQNLAFRLDYNDFYKRGDSKLHEPLTYQHQRLSEITFSKVRAAQKSRKK